MKGVALLMAFGWPAEMTPQQKLGYGYLTGMMPLHMAATEEIAKLLISRGADLNDVNAKIEGGPNQGKTPLDLAIEYNQKETADFLRKHGGKIWHELKAEGAK